MSDTTTTERRGAAYMPEQRLLIFHVSPELVDATVVGDRESYRVYWIPRVGWSCTCPAQTAACGHIAAVRSIVVLYPVSADDCEEQ